jgi:hypothetical protein
MPIPSITIKTTRSDDPLVVVGVPVMILGESLKRQLLPVSSDTGQIIWTGEGNSEVLVNVKGVQIAINAGLILVQLPLSVEHLPNTSLVIPYRVGSSFADAALVAVTEKAPRGNDELATAWGRIAQEAVWNAFLRLSNSLRALPSFPSGEWALVGLFATPGKLTFIFARPVTKEALQEYTRTVHHGKLTLPNP